MRAKRIFHLLLALWELCRIILLVMTFSQALFATLIPRFDALLLVLLLASGNLLIPGGALYVYITDKSSQTLNYLFITGKITGCAICFLNILIVISTFVQALTRTSLPLHTFFEGMLLAIIFFIDLIFLLILLSFKKKGGERQQEEKQPRAEKLPEFKETEIPNKPE